MVIIDDAGTGCMLGLPIVVGMKETSTAMRFFKDIKGSSACDEVFDILAQLHVEKDEEINICRGNVFDGFCKCAKEQGYTNIKRIVVDGLVQDIAEDKFTTTLHELGVSESVVLVNKDYVKFHLDLCAELMLKPELQQYVKPHYLVTKSFTTLFNKVDRLNNEFPNLVEQMKILK